MSISDRIVSLAQAIAADIKTLFTSKVDVSKVGGLGAGQIPTVDELGAMAFKDSGLAARTTKTVSTGLSAIDSGKTALYIHIATDAPGRIRIYSTAQARASDASRPVSTDAPTGAGLLFEFVSTSGLLQAPLAPSFVAANGDQPSAGVVYCNVEGSATAVTFTYLGLE